MTEENTQEDDNENGGGPAQRVDDDELVARLKKATQQTEYPPVLSTSDVAELLPIGREAVRRRLNSLSDDDEYDTPPIRKYKAGRNPVWWVPDEREGGEVDTGFLQDGTLDLSAPNLRDRIDPSDIPEDIAAQAAVEHDIIEEYSPSSKWEEDRSAGKAAISLGFVIIAVPVLVSLSNVVSVPETAIGAVALIGFVFAGMGLGVLLEGLIMGIFARFGYAPKNRWPTLEESKAVLRGETPDFEKTD